LGWNFDFDFCVILWVMKVKNYSVVLKSEPDGGYTAIVPSLPGCVTYGKTIEQAKKMAKDAIESYLYSLNKHSDEIPEEQNVFLTSISIQGLNFPFANA